MPLPDAYAELKAFGLSMHNALVGHKIENFTN